MRPLDPRLLRRARATRWFLAASVAIGLASALLLIIQATLLARMITDVFLAGAGLSSLRTPLIGLGVVVTARAVLAWVQEAAAFGASASVKSALRRQLLAHAATLPERRTGELAALATRGIDALDGYFARYLPQLVLAVVVPLAVGLRLLTADWLTAAIVAVTLPLIPLFMALVGLWTKARTERQWNALSRLSGHFLDVVVGLPTLVVFGRAKAQVATVRRVTEEYRRTTMGVLRAAFLSSLVLELLATISVALVAVSVGLRLVDGALGLETGLLVLILAPEVYLPLRQVGAQFHANTEGLEAAGEVFAVLETPRPSCGSRLEVPAGALALDAVTVRYPGRPVPALKEMSLRVAPGRVTALCGPSGAGKSTVLAVLLGLVRPDGGTVTVGGVDVASLDRRAWWDRIAWVPQRPVLVAGTIAENIRLGRPDAPDGAVSTAAEAAALDPGRFPRGLDTVLGEDGAGLSAGERQRVGLARALLRDAPILLLDEPTANLDQTTESQVVAGLRRAVVGRTVVVVTHRPALLALADEVVTLPAGERAGDVEERVDVAEGRAA